MMSKEQVHEVMMGIQPEWRYRWCGGGWCGCMGCSNVSGGVTSKGVTKDQWDEWVAANPDPNPPQPFDHAAFEAALNQASQEYRDGKSCTQDELKDRLRQKFQK